jgi:mannose-6-phosphate isomerase-like protein (cupin superfamily)
VHGATLHQQGHLLPATYPDKETAMHGYVDNIEDLTDANTDFRMVLYTGHHLQLVLMALKPGQDIGAETHTTHDQFFRIEEGHGQITIDGHTTPVKGGYAIIVPAGALHNLQNTGDKVMRLYTLYGPPNHIDKLVEPRKADALQSQEVFDGVASE